jgi:hypothetical protein
VKSGHGKPGAGGGQGRTRSFTLDSPPVHQWTLNGDWHLKASSATSVDVHYTFFDLPSTPARILPEQLLGAIQEQGVLGDFTSQSDFFDDHYGYAGNLIALRLQQNLPAEFQIAVKASYQNKTYTIPAKDLSDTLVLASQRLDTRVETVLSLSKTFHMGASSLQPKVEYVYLRNSSNAPYYGFDKNTFLIGIDYDY